MNTSIAADALRNALTQSVSLITQTSGVQALVGEIGQQQSPAKPVNAPAGQPATRVATVLSDAARAESTSVELSPSALLPPVVNAGPAARINDAKVQTLLIASTQINANVATNSDSTSQRADAMRLAVSLSDSAKPPVATPTATTILGTTTHARAESAYRAWQQTGSPVLQSAAAEAQPKLLALTDDTANPPRPAASSELATMSKPEAALVAARDSISQQTAAPSPQQPLPRLDLSGAAAYTAVEPRIPLRMKIARHADDESVEADRQRLSRAMVAAPLSVTLHLVLPRLGPVVATLHMSAQSVDIAVAAPKSAIADLTAQQPLLELAAQAWGLNVREIVFAPVDVMNRPS